MFTKKEQGGKSIFGGMKIKGPNKSQVVQSEMYLGGGVSSVNDVVIVKEEPVVRAKIEERVHDDAIQEQERCTFEMPGLSKNRGEQVRAEVAKSGKKNQNRVEIGEKQKKDGDVGENNQYRAVSVPVEESRKVAIADEGIKQERKQMIAETNSITIEKRKDKNKIESNPFMNQLKKNQSNSLREPQEHHGMSTIMIETQASTSSVTLQSKKPKKNEKENLLSEIRQFHIKTIDFILKQKQVKDTIIQIAGNLEENRRQLAEVTKKQLLCISKEEYEQADSCQTKIENLQKKIEEQEMELNGKQNEFYSNEYEQLKVEKTHHYESKALICKIKLVELQLLEDSSNIKKKKVECEENYNMKMENENKSIVRLENDIRFQSQQINNLQKRYEQNLNSRKNPLNIELNENKKRKSRLDEEIEQLQKRLRQKKETVREVNTKITTLKKEIKEVDDIYTEQKIKLQERKGKLTQLQQEKKKLANNVQMLEKKKLSEVEIENKKAEELEVEARNIAEMAYQMEQSSNNIEEKLEQKKVKVDTFIHNTKDLKNFQMKNKENQEKIKELEYRKENKIAEVSSLEEKKIQIKQKIPKLQSEQKSMVLSKNFKGASMKKSQIKEAERTIQQLTKKIEECFVTQKEIEELITRKNEQENNNINEQNEIKKNLAVSQFKFNLVKIEELEEEKEWINKFNENTEIQGKYGNVLNQEIQYLKDEIRFIGEEYGLNLDVLNKNKKEKGKGGGEDTGRQDSEAKSDGCSKQQTNNEEAKQESSIPNQQSKEQQIEEEKQENSQMQQKLSSRQDQQKQMEPSSSKQEQGKSDLKNEMESKGEDRQQDSSVKGIKGKETEREKQEKVNRQNNENDEKNNEQQQQRNGQKQGEQNKHRQDEDNQNNQEKEQDDQRGGYVPLMLD